MEVLTMILLQVKAITRVVGVGRFAVEHIVAGFVDEEREQINLLVIGNITIHSQLGLVSGILYLDGAGIDTVVLSGTTDGDQGVVTVVENNLESNIQVGGKSGVLLNSDNETHV